MKRISGSILVALLSITMTGCFFEKANRTPLEFSSTPPTTAVVGEEYRYDITVIPEFERDYEITAEGLPSWLELKTEASLPVNVGNFNGGVISMAADGEDIYFAGVKTALGLVSSFAIYKTRIDSTEQPQVVFDALQAGAHAIGGLAIDNRVLYFTEHKRRASGPYTTIYKLNLAVSNSTVETITEVPGDVKYITVRDGTLHLTDGSSIRKFLSLDNPNNLTQIRLTHAVDALGIDSYNTIRAATLGAGFILVELIDFGKPNYNNDAVDCTAGFAGYTNLGTYFANIGCYIGGKYNEGYLSFVAVDAPSKNSSGIIVYEPGEILDGSATAVTVTGSGKVVWASQKEQSLRTFTVQENTLVGTPPQGSAGSYPITLRLPTGDTQEFTLVVTAPPVSYEVTGTVYGLEGSLQLSNNARDTLRISTEQEGNSVFSFNERLQQGEAYNISVQANPAGQSCNLRDGQNSSGTIGTSNVELIVDCEFNTYRIGGTVSGLNGELALRLSSEQGQQDLLLSDNGRYEFAGDFISGDEYSLSIENQPVGQICELTTSFTDEAGNEQSPVVTGPVDLPIRCTTDTTPRSLSVTVTGLPDGLVVDMLAVGPADNRWGQEVKSFGTGSGSFNNSMLDSEIFDIRVNASPDGYSCSVTGESPLSGSADGVGRVAGNVTVTVNCTANAVEASRNLFVEVIGLPGGSSVAMRAIAPPDGSWQQEDKVFSTGTAAFNNTLLDGELFGIQILTNPGGYSCSITGESPFNGPIDGIGIVDGNITVTVTCAATVVATPRSLSVEVLGLPGGTTVAMRAFGPADGRWLQESKAFGTGTGSFNNTMFDGETFDIRIILDPGGYSCSITSESPLDGSVDGAGTINGDLTVTVTCTVVVTTRSLSVEVLGLPPGTPVTMRALGPADLRWTVEDKDFELGTASFNNTMLDGETFNISIFADPGGFTCTIIGESPLDGAPDGTGIVSDNIIVTVDCI